MAAPSQPLFISSILGPLELVTAPTTAAIQPIEAKRQMRVETTEEDSFIESLIERATYFCQHSIEGHRQIMLATYDLPVFCWWEGPLNIPRPPLSSITSVKYYDTSGTLTTLSSSVYLTRTPWRQPGSVERAPGQTWPGYQSDRRLPIVIRFVAGYASASVVPPSIKQAILMVVGHWYENREASAAGQVPKEIEMAVTSLLETEGWGAYG